MEQCLAFVGEFNVLSPHPLADPKGLMGGAVCRIPSPLRGRVEVSAAFPPPRRGRVRVGASLEEFYNYLEWIIPEGA